MMRLFIKILFVLVTSSMIFWFFYYKPFNSLNHIKNNMHNVADIFSINSITFTCIMPYYHNHVKNDDENSRLINEYLLKNNYQAINDHEWAIVFVNENKVIMNTYYKPRLAVMHNNKSHPQICGSAVKLRFYLTKSNEIYFIKEE